MKKKKLRRETRAQFQKRLRLLVLEMNYVRGTLCTATLKSISLAVNLTNAAASVSEFIDRPKPKGKT